MERTMPGRLVGVSKDSAGNLRTVWLWRLVSSTFAVKATSNICTAQALLAIVAGATRCTTVLRVCALSRTACTLMPLVLLPRLKSAGYGIAHDTFFDTVVVEAAGRADEAGCEGSGSWREHPPLRTRTASVFPWVSLGEGAAQGPGWGSGRHPGVSRCTGTICPLSCCVPMTTCSTRFSTSTVPRPR